MSDIKKYWVGFTLVRGIGAMRLRSLLEYFGDVETAWNASPGELRKAGLGPKLIDGLISTRNDISLAQVCDKIAAQNIKILTWNDADYPRRLKEIDQPPPVLFYRGSLTPEDEWSVAIVGTRRVTPYGRQVAEELASILARSGVTVVSGLARGVDAIAHKSSLNAGGRTFAVMGSGVDRIYPPEHRRLAEEIMQRGALISDYAPGTPPEGVNFPPRNRIISGLSIATVVVEAGERSGALITANFAADQGRDVFAVPGSIHAPQSIGTNKLIQQGARPLLDPKEILEALDLTMVSEHRSARVILPADSTEAKLLGLLSQEPRHVDELRLQMEMPIEQVTATLALMELKGMVRQVGGMNYVAVREQASDYRVSGSQPPSE